MNQQTSPARRHRYDIARVIRVWQLSRTTFRGGPHPLDRFSSQLRWNPVHDSSDLGLTGTGA